MLIVGEPESQLNETINYNEHFDWRWEQGRFGFGIFGMFMISHINLYLLFYKILK